LYKFLKTLCFSSCLVATTKLKTAMAQAKATHEPEEIYQEFKELVNMTPEQLEKWLNTEDSKKVGFKEDNAGESVGHQSGGKIIAIKQKKKSELTDDDYAHMQKVVGYIKRHSAQKPKGDVTDTNWRFSLMNWGHDPEKS
jgi:LPS O-antigen subunit length determinant protein (WzzB/FepE family)